MSSKLTGSDLNLDFKITTNGGTDVVLTPVLGLTTPDGQGVTTIDLNGAGAHYPAAGGGERYRITIRKIN